MRKPYLSQTFQQTQLKHLMKQMYLPHLLGSALLIMANLPHSKFMAQQKQNMFQEEIKSRATTTYFILLLQLILMMF